MKGRNIMETIKGLTHEEVEEKIKQGKSNKVKIKTNESILKILRKNIFTYFNFKILKGIYKLQCKSLTYLKPLCNN